MRRYISLILFIGLAFWSCEEEQEPEDCAGVAGGDNICGCTDSTATNYDSTATFDDESCEYDTTPPTVSISSPVSGQTVYEIVTITVTTQDNEGISKVEFFINDSLVLIDSESPYQYEWNTTQYEDGEHIVKVVSYDNSDNSTESQPIMLNVDNVSSHPQSSQITSIEFQNGGFSITWNQSIDSDFGSYDLEKSVESEMNDYEVVYTSQNIMDTSYIDNEGDPLIYQYYRITVTDTLGLESKGQIVSSSLDPVPVFVNVTSVTYTFEEMTIEWEESSDGDFKDYKLLYSETEWEDKDTLITYTDKSTTFHTITEFDPTHENWFWILVSDTLGQISVGSGMTNEIDSPPAASEIDSIIYENDSFIITWSQNSDDDFSSYTLYESFFEDMSDKTISFSTNNFAQTNYTVTGINEGEFRYYQVVVEDIWGLQSVSNIDFGDSHNWFVNNFGGWEDEGGRSVQQTEDGGYIVCGYSGDYATITSIYIIKLDLKGNEEWHQTIGFGTGYSIKQTVDGGYIIAGEKPDVVTQPLLIKTDSQGQTEWEKNWWDVYGQGANARFVEITNDGGYIITGSAYVMETDSKDVLLIKTDSQGDTLWTKTFNLAGHDFGFSVKQTFDGGFIIAGSTSNSYEFADGTGFLLKTDSNGNEVWTKYIGNGTYLSSVAINSDGGYSATGGIVEVGFGAWRVLLIGVNSEGMEVWNNEFGENLDNQYNSGKCLINSAEGGYVITGYTNNYGNGMTDVWLIKTDSDGNEVWNKTFGGSNSDEGYSVQQTTDGGYIITGHTYSFGNGGSSDVWLIKTDSEGNTADYGD